MRRGGGEEERSRGGFTCSRWEVGGRKGYIWIGSMSKFFLIGSSWFKWLWRVLKMLLSNWKVVFSGAAHTHIASNELSFIKSSIRSFKRGGLIWMWIFSRSHICCPTEDQKWDDVSLGRTSMLKQQLQWKIGGFRLQGCRILQAVFTGFTGLGQWTKRGKFDMFQQKKNHMKL